MCDHDGVWGWKWLMLLPSWQRWKPSRKTEEFRAFRGKPVTGESDRDPRCWLSCVRVGPGSSFLRELGRFHLGRGQVASFQLKEMQLLLNSLMPRTPVRML